MRIDMMISWLDLENVPIIPLQNGTKGRLPIYASKQGVCYYKDETIWSLSIVDDCKDEVYKIKRALQLTITELKDNERELDKYMAVTQLLIAIDQYKGGTGKIDIELVKKYVQTMNEKVYEALDFTQIENMDSLKKLLREDDLYRELVFVVNEVKCPKYWAYRGHGIEKNKYEFGNTKYHEDLDVVSITVYDDWVELDCRKEGRGAYKRQLKPRRAGYTLEQKIKAALDCWRGAY